MVDWYAVATLISCTTATADGLPRWTGLYMGAHVGWGRASISGSDNMMAFDEQTTVGWLGGGQLGYNHQLRSVALGNRDVSMLRATILRGSVLLTFQPSLAQEAPNRWDCFCEGRLCQCPPSGLSADLPPIRSRVLG